MCGIVGAAARRDIVPILVEGLRRLEYRGYDSAGIAVLKAPNGAAQPVLERVRAAGRVAELASQVEAKGVESATGIAHTRWATHGAPTEGNAHPHVSGGLAVVHNGIIENHEPLRARLKGVGFAFASETDTEVIAHLVSHHRRCEPGPPGCGGEGGRRTAGCVRDRTRFAWMTRVWWYWRARARRCSSGLATARTSPPPTFRRCCRSRAA